MKWKTVQGSAIPPICTGGRVTDRPRNEVSCTKISRHSRCWYFFTEDSRQNIFVLLVVFFGSGLWFGIFYPFCEINKEAGH
jgi:hypothetical protein